LGTNHFTPGKKEGRSLPGSYQKAGGKAQKQKKKKETGEGVDQNKNRAQKSKWKREEPRSGNGEKKRHSRGGRGPRESGQPKPNGKRWKKEKKKIYEKKATQTPTSRTRLDYDDKIHRVVQLRAR